MLIDVITLATTCLSTCIVEWGATASAALCRQRVTKMPVMHCTRATTYGFVLIDVIYLQRQCLCTALLSGGDGPAASCSSRFDMCIKSVAWSLRKACAVNYRSVSSVGKVKEKPPKTIGEPSVIVPVLMILPCVLTLLLSHVCDPGGEAVIPNTITLL